MKSDLKNKPTDFWTGFAFGASIAVSLGYFLGTKTGRNYARKILDFSDNLDGNIKTLLKSINEKDKGLGDEIRKFAKQNLDEVISKLKSKT